ncbi:hypothetical protein [Enterovibrio norvegicus]|uniref:hypothetical protein n=1 Tax=Enterovibrio norvegicus TaxID=188144 RepID=UPI000C8624BE|nr:hypothetical protein [Enterovibrio norvegicus]PMN64310.1 hypothetical protein BCT27_10115 [Enterovibrio norvegicus]
MASRDFLWNQMSSPNFSASTAAMGQATDSFSNALAGLTGMSDDIKLAERELLQREHDLNKMALEEEYAIASDARANDYWGQQNQVTNQQAVDAAKTLAEVSADAATLAHTRGEQSAVNTWNRGEQSNVNTFNRNTQQSINDQTITYANTPLSYAPDGTPIKPTNEQVREYAQGLSSIYGNQPNRVGSPSGIAPQPAPIAVPNHEQVESAGHPYKVSPAQTQATDGSTAPKDALMRELETIEAKIEADRGLGGHHPVDIALANSSKKPPATDPLSKAIAEVEQGEPTTDDLEQVLLNTASIQSQQPVTQAAPTAPRQPVPNPNAPAQQANFESTGNKYADQVLTDEGFQQPTQFKTAEAAKEYRDAQNKSLETVDGINSQLQLVDSMISNDRGLEASTGGLAQYASQTGEDWFTLATRAGARLAESAATGFAEATGQIDEDLAGDRTNFRAGGLQVTSKEFTNATNKNGSANMTDADAKRYISAVIPYEEALADPEAMRGVLLKTKVQLEYGKAFEALKAKRNGKPPTPAERTTLLRRIESDNGITFDDDGNVHFQTQETRDAINVANRRSADGTLYQPFSLTRKYVDGDVSMGEDGKLRMFKDGKILIEGE